MTISAWQIWLISVCNGICVCLLILGALCTVICGIFLCCAVVTDDREAVPRLKKAVIAGVISIMLGVLIPDKKTICAMYVIPAVVNNEKIQGIAGNGLEMLEILTKQWLEDLKGKENVAGNR